MRVGETDRYTQAVWLRSLLVMVLDTGMPSRVMRGWSRGSGMICSHWLTGLSPATPGSRPMLSRPSSTDWLAAVPSMMSRALLP